MSTTTHTLESLIADCIQAACVEGWTGVDREYALTQADCEYIIDQLGRKPTRDEWTMAGMGYVGNAHVADE